MNSEAQELSFRRAALVFLRFNNLLKVEKHLESHCLVILSIYSTEYMSGQADKVCLPRHYVLQTCL